MKNLNESIAATFLQIAEGLETGSFGKKPRIAVTGISSEHGEENVLRGALQAAKNGIDVTYIGTVHAEGIVTAEADCETAAHEKMTELLENGTVDGAVTMHFPFPIGVTTVGRLCAPATGKQLFLASTTGTSSPDRVEALVKNALCGLAAAKAAGIEAPTLGILNIDGARQAEIVLNQLKKAGYDFTWAESARADGGAVMRGNDILLGSPDVLVCDSLTGNILMKLLSAYPSGGSREVSGWGYGPGIGPDFTQLVCIVSRASGSAVIAGAIQYAADMVRGRLFEKAAAEFASADQSGLKDLLSARKHTEQPVREAVKAPPAEPCTASIPGIEVMDLEDAAALLWKNGIYAETGMGCTGPLVMMSQKNLARSAELLKQAGFIG